MNFYDVIDIKIPVNGVYKQVEKIVDLTPRNQKSYKKVIWQVPRCTTTFRDNIPVTLYYDIGEFESLVVGNAENHGDTVQSMQATSQQIMYLVPIGQIHCVNDIVSGFSSTSYARTPIYIDWTPSNSFEMTFKLTTGNNVSSRQEIFSMTNTESMELEILNNKLHWELAGKYSNFQLNANTTYWIRFSKEATNIAIHYSTDGLNYATAITSTFNRTVTNEYMHFGADVVTGGAVIESFLGTFDLSQWSITYNDVQYRVKMYDDSYLELVRDGNITVNDITLDTSGFTTSSHAHTPIVINWTNTNETGIVMCFTTTNDLNKLKQRQELFGMQSTDNFELEIYSEYDNQPRLHWELLGYGQDSYGKTVLKCNTKYYVKFIKDKYTYTISMSEGDDTHYSVEIGPGQSTRTCQNEYLYIGVDKQSVCEPFTGTIHVSQCSLSYNGKNYRFRI